MYQSGEEEELADDQQRRLHGPLESMLPISIVLAIIALVLWLALFANHLPLGREQLVP
jgi:p-aminobenzoyl-glutamate transporter AbgT